MNAEDVDFKFARLARGNSKDFKRLCLLSLGYRAKTINVRKLSSYVNAEVFPKEETRRSPSFTRKA
jgi:hypothetical protein